MLIKKGDNISELVTDIKEKRYRNYDNSLQETQRDTTYEELLQELSPVTKTITKTGLRLLAFKLFGIG